MFDVVSTLRRRGYRRCRMGGLIVVAVAGHRPFIYKLKDQKELTYLCSCQ